jgi:hypothetical protein
MAQSAAEQQAASIAAQNERLKADRQFEKANNQRGSTSPLGGLSKPGSGSRAQPSSWYFENNIRKVLRERPKR